MKPIFTLLMLIIFSYNVSLGQPGGTVLPIYGFTIKASAQNQSVKIWWKTDTEIGTDFFVLERSTDGTNFTAIDSTKAAGNSNYSIEYELIDESPFSNFNYYRIREVSINRTMSYSAIAKVNIKKSINISVFPNPIEDHFTINYQELAPAKLKIIDGMGRLVKMMKINGGEGKIRIEAAMMHKGMYTLMIETSTGLVYSQHLIKN